MPRLIGSIRPLATTLHPDRKAWSNPYPEDEFVVGTTNGFLPRADPLERLPAEFSALESLLQRMPRQLKDGSPGLLATGGFGDAVKAELPEYPVDHVQDTRLLSALYRDYTFAASAYLLEPCDIQYRKTGEYGLARHILPRNLAVPLTKVAEKIGAKPFMEYALSYSLYNYHRNASNAPEDYENLRLIRSFTDTPDEHGFILVHVAMVRHSGNLVKHAIGALNAAGKDDRPAFDAALHGVATAYRSINRTMESMWSHSSSSGYKGFRTFIMGSKNQPMFPRGIIYEGTGDLPGQGRLYRGESGANDSMIPLGDNLMELTARIPANPLTSVLKDFRQYRPRNHRAFLAWSEERAREVGVHAYARADAHSAALALRILDQIRDFRHRHWLFTKEYILKHSSHPVATGGSPIVTWLPNQLTAVLDAMEDMGASIHETRLPAHEWEEVGEIKERASAQKRVLAREVSGMIASRANEDGGRAVDGDMALKGERISGGAQAQA